MRRKIAFTGMALAGITGISIFAQDAANVKPISHAYHLTYTFTEMNGSKRIGVQHYTLSITDDNNGNADFRNDSRVPVEVGTGTITKSIDTLEVGLKIHARLRSSSSGLELSGSVDRTDFADPADSSIHRPVIRNLDLETTTLLTPDKTVMLGSLDQPGSTEHLDVSVLIEPIR
jgi:hypothetical protein